MVKAAGFKPRIVQICVPNLTSSAKHFLEKQIHIKINLNLAPRLPCCKMMDFNFRFHLKLSSWWPYWEAPYQILSDDQFKISGLVAILGIANSNSN